MDFAQMSPTDPRRREWERAQEQPDAPPASTAGNELAAVREEAGRAFESGSAVYFVIHQVTSSAGGMTGTVDALAGSLKHRPTGEVIDAIESVGWQLDKMDHVWVPGATVRLGGPMTLNPGIVQGHYLFRRPR